MFALTSFSFTLSFFICWVLLALLLELLDGCTIWESIFSLLVGLPPLQKLSLVSNKFNFLLEQFISKEKSECQAGLKPVPLAVWASALTFRPHALYALSLP